MSDVETTTCKHPKKDRVSSSVCECVVCGLCDKLLYDCGGH